MLCYLKATKDYRCGICGWTFKGSVAHIHQENYHPRMPRFFTVGKTEKCLWQMILGEDDHYVIL